MRKEKKIKEKGNGKEKGNKGLNKFSILTRFGRVFLILSTFLFI